MENVTEQLNVIDYSRQATLDALMTQKMTKSDVNIIVGCGGIGFWLGLQLAMLGYRHFILIDGQKVDYSNLNRLPVPQAWVGLNKAVALRKIIRSLRIDTIVLAVSTHVAKDTMSILKNATSRFPAINNGGYYYSQNCRATLWDTTDDAKIQNELCKYAKDVQNLEYRKLGYEGFEIGAYKDYSVWTPETYTTGYRTSNANAVTSAISAGMGIFARCLTEQDMQIDLKEIILTKQKKFKGSDEIKRLEKVIAVHREYVSEDDIDSIDERLKEQGLI